MNKKEVDQALRDYHWMINEIKRQREQLAYITARGLVAQGGVESSMPKPQGVSSDPVALEVIRRDTAYRWIEKLEEKVLFIQKRIPVITDQREKAVLGCMLDGMSMVAIGKHMGLSRRHIYTIKESIISQIAQTSHFAHSSHDMTKEKACV